MSTTKVTIFKTIRTNVSPSEPVTITPQVIDAITGVGNGIEISDYFLCTECTLEVNNTTLEEKTVTIKAGKHSSAIASGAGDKTYVIPASTKIMIDQIESARFKKDNGGGLVVEFQTGMTGDVYATGKSRGIG